MENEKGEEPDGIDATIRDKKFTFYELGQHDEQSFTSSEESWEISESISIGLSETEQEEADESDSDDSAFKNCSSLFLDSESRMSSPPSPQGANKISAVQESWLEADHEAVFSIWAPSCTIGPQSRPYWKSVKSTYGMVAEPTESELAENTWGFGESFADYMSRLNTVADPGLSHFNTDFTADPTEEEEVLTSDSDDNFWANEQYCGVGWEALSRFRDPWAETRYPTPNLLTREELTAEDWESAELSIEKIACSISNFTIPPGCTQYACTKLQAENMGIQSVKILSGYEFLQYIDLMSNKIEDLSPLWEIPHLVVLDVSHNLVNDEGFGHPTIPQFLTYLNLSHNRLTKVPDVTACWALKHLNLSHNSIERIENLENLDYLQYLNISNNQLEIVDNLLIEHLSELDLSQNKISGWDPEQNNSLKKLVTLNLSKNNLVSLHQLKEIGTLQNLDVSYNQIYRLTEFGYLECFPQLRILTILGNPLDSSITDSRKLLIFKLIKLEVLNGVPVLQKERSKAIMQYSLEEFHETMCRGATLFFRRHCFTPFLQFERPKAVIHPAIVVFVGLLGSHRAKIMFECERMNPRKVRVSEIYSTRPKHRHPPHWSIAAAQALQKYVPDKTFYKLQASGKFVATYNDLGYRFGIPTSEFEYTDQVLLIMSSFSAALDLVSKGFNPILLLVLPISEENYKKKVVYWLSTSHTYTSDIHTRLVGEKIFNKKKKSRRKTAPNLRHSLQHKTQARETSKHSHSSRATKLNTHKKRISIPRDSSITETQKKHAEEAGKNRFILNMLQMREHYINEHIQKPGLFRLFIPSDNVEYAIKKSNEIIEEAYESLTAQKEKSSWSLPFSEDPLFEEMVMPVAREYADEILSERGPTEMF